jgi:hypothetical protein
MNNRKRSASMVRLRSDGLPKEVFLPMTWGKLKNELFAVLGAIIILNFALYLFLGEYTSNYGYWVIKSKWRLLTRLEEPVDWLILGDSSANQGVIPAVILEETGKTAVNLGTVGNMTAIGDLWMLEEYIARHGPPEKVVIIHVYDMWHRRFFEDLVSHVPLPWGFWERYSLSNQVITDDLHPVIFQERYLPLYSQTRTLQDILFRWLTRLDNPFDNGFAVTESGYFPAYDPKPDSVLLGLEDNIRFVDENAFSLSEINRAAVSEIVRHADELGFDLYFVNSPLHEDLSRYPDFQIYLNDLFTSLEEVAQGSPNVHLIREVRGYSEEQLQTVDHLIDPGAEDYTRWLVETVK